MKFEIAKHAFGLIARNIGMAVRIVVLPWILIRMLNYVLLFLLFITGLGQAETIPGSGVFLVWNLFHFVVVFAGTVWIMIGWNRFILLDDLTDTNWPQWSWALVKAYLIRFFFIVTALIVPLLITILVSTVLNEARGEHLGANAHTLLMRILSEVVTCMLFFYCLFRISLGLPSAALGKRMYIRESFSKTKSYGGDIWGASFVVSLMFLIERALETDSAPTMLTNMADAIVGAFTILYFASIMITLYGVAEEGRALN